MTENNSFWQHPAVFFITRTCILAGMMLVFWVFASSVGIYTIKSFFGVDYLQNPQILTDYKNPAVVSSLKYIQVLTSIAVFIIPAWHFSKALNQLPVDFLKLNRKLKWNEALVATALVFAVMPFISWLIYINQNIKLPASLAALNAQLQQAEATTRELTILFLEANNLTTLAINLVVVALLPAVAEEFLFRGALQNFLRSTFQNNHVAVWVVAILFSAIHLQFSGFFPRLFLGALLGYAYLYTGNLWITIIMHFVNNGFAVVCNYGPIKANLPAIMQDDYVFEAWYINAGSALLGIALLLVLKNITFKRVWYNGE